MSGFEVGSVLICLQQLPDLITHPVQLMPAVVASKIDEGVIHLWLTLKITGAFVFVASVFVFAGSELADFIGCENLIVPFNTERATGFD